MQRMAPTRRHLSAKMVVVINHGEMRQPRNVIIVQVGRTNVRLRSQLKAAVLHIAVSRPLSYGERTKSYTGSRRSGWAMQWMPPPAWVNMVMSGS
jgi:hypothetical protein